MTRPLDRTKERHAPDEGCLTHAHCHSCHVDEVNEPGDYRVCGECGHIFRQPIDLLNADTFLAEQINKGLAPGDRIVIHDDPDKVVTCPLCTHDF